MDTKIKNKIMTRVYGIWFVRRVVPLLLLEIVVLFGAVNFFASQVFVEKVFANSFAIAVGNPIKIANYFASAFVGTGIETQFITLALLIAGILLLKDINKAVTSYTLVRRNRLSGSAV